MKKSVVLAYSGGLDTSYCIAYLTAELGYTVHAIHVNTGGVNQADLQSMEDRAYQLGASYFESIDRKEKYYEGAIKYLIYGNILRNDTYPISVSSERIFQAIAIAEYCLSIDSQLICHGSTGAGNDQVRFDLIFQTLIPNVDIISPIRDQKISREEEVQYLEKSGFSWLTEKKDYSINEGLWGTTIGGVETLTSHRSLPNDAYPSQLNKSESQSITIKFSDGEAVEIDGQPFDHAVDLIEKLNSMGADYAIGRDIHVGDTSMGIKGRVAFEAPAAMMLIKAHQLLEKHTLTKWQAYWKKQLSEWYGMMMHEGHYLDPVMRNIEGFLKDTQARVSGEVYLQLHPYRFELLGVKSKYDLMQAKFGVYGEMNHAWTGTEARAYIKLMSTPFKIFQDLELQKEKI